MDFSSTFKRAVISMGLGVFLAPAVFAQVAIIDANSRRSAPPVESGSQTTSYPDPSSGAVSYPADNGGYQSPSASSNGAAASSSRAGAVSAPAGNSQVDFLNRLQTLEDEVMKLQGILEEQQHQLEQLKQQRLEDYQSLDKRISESPGRGSLRGIPAAGAVAAGAEAGAAAIDASETPAEPAASAAGELKSSPEGEKAYQDAYALISAKKHADARVAFQKFLKKYPNDALVPNAMYWLGQLYVIESNDDSAQAIYTKLIEQYPDNRKAPDAMYKLAQIYYEKGNKAKSKSLLQSLIKQYSGSGSPTVGLAKDYLKQNF
jgi:tol-pal system protein YbgF